MSTNEMKQDIEAGAELYRDLFELPKGEQLVIFKPVGIQGCPIFSGGDQGTANCPLWNWKGGELPPNEPQPWMKGRCQDDSWRERWREILSHCRQCQGRPSYDPSSQVYRLLLKGDKNVES